MDASGNAKKQAPLTAGLDRLRISEVVLKTSQFDKMRQWYVDVLGIEPFYERRPERTGGADGKYLRASDVALCFFRLHLDYPYTQVLAIFEVPGLDGDGKTDPGLHHMQLRHASLEKLVERYDRLTAAGFKPHRTANHGPGTSFYYFDPDGNNVELSGPNFDTEAEYLAYFESDSYKRNPSGIEIDVEEYVGRFKSGVPKSELVKIG